MSQTNYLDIEKSCLEETRKEGLAKIVSPLIAAGVGMILLANTNNLYEMIRGFYFA